MGARLTKKGRQHKATRILAFLWGCYRCHHMRARCWDVQWSTRGVLLRDSKISQGRTPKVVCHEVQGLQKKSEDGEGTGMGAGRFAKGGRQRGHCSRSLWELPNGRTLSVCEQLCVPSSLRLLSLWHPISNGASQRLLVVCLAVSQPRVALCQTCPSSLPDYTKSRLS